MPEEVKFNLQEYLGAMEDRLGDRIDAVSASVATAVADARVDGQRLSAVEARTGVLSKAGLALLTAMLGLLATLIGHMAYGSPAPALASRPTTIPVTASR